MKPQALIIEDNKLNSEVLETLLDQQGFTAVSIDTPRHLEETLAQLDNLKVIFLDLELPNYDGIEIHEEIRDWNEFQGVPIVAYTVHTSEIEVVRQAGFHSFLGKPLEPEKFPEQLADILANKPVWSA